MKRKLAIILTAFLALFLVNTAHSFDLGVSTLTEFEIDFDNWESLTDPLTLVDSNGDYYANGGDGTDDNYGSFMINDIMPTGSLTPLWESGDDDEYLVGHFYGIDYQKLDVNLTTGQTNIQSVGGTFEIYLLNQTQFSAFEASLMGGVNPYAGNAPGDYTQYAGLTDLGINTFLTFDLVPGIDPLSDATIDGDADASTNPMSGDAAWWAEITGGDYAWLFDTNQYSNSYTNDANDVVQQEADLYGYTDFGPDGDGTWFDLESQDPIEGFAAPEPTTMLLLGFGLLGLAGVSRKRNNV